MDEPDSSSVATKSGDDESSEEQKPSADVYDFDTHEAKKVKIIKKTSPFIEFRFSYFLICLGDFN